ncbi:MAG: DUF3592 domain-containing protein [Gemmatimonadales bacterium]
MNQSLLELFIRSFLPALVGTVLLVTSTRRLRLGAGSRGWPSVDGIILDVRRGPAWVPAYLVYRRWRGLTVRYRYSVAGVTYESTTVGVHQKLDTPPEYRKSDRVRYHNGQRVVVRYDPLRPGRAVLEPGTSYRDIVIIVVVGVGLAALVWWGTTHYAIAGG